MQTWNNLFLTSDMKQNITKEQWNELSEEQKLASTFRKEIELIPGATQDLLPNIGQMIEFLGDGWHYAVHEEVFKEGDKRIWLKFVKPKELCDALWEACKEKLNK